MVSNVSKTMPEETSTFPNTENYVIIPSHWTRPLYRLGQMVKQGQIIGIEYQPPGTKRAHDLGVGWNYTVLPNPIEFEVENVRESDIKLLTASDLQSQIKYQSECAKILTENLSILREQLTEIEP